MIDSFTVGYTAPVNDNNRDEDDLTLSLLASSSLMSLLLLQHCSNTRTTLPTNQTVLASFTGLRTYTSTVPSLPTIFRILSKQWAALASILEPAPGVVLPDNDRTLLESAAQLLVLLLLLLLLPKPDDTVEDLLGLEPLFDAAACRWWPPLGEAWSCGAGWNAAIVVREAR